MKFSVTVISITLMFFETIEANSDIQKATIKNSKDIFELTATHYKKISSGTAIINLSYIKNGKKMKENSSLSSSLIPGQFTDLKPMLKTLSFKNQSPLGFQFDYVVNRFQHLYFFLLPDFKTKNTSQLKFLSCDSMKEPSVVVTDLAIDIWCFKYKIPMSNPESYFLLTHIKIEKEKTWANIYQTKIGTDESKWPQETKDVNEAHFREYAALFISGCLNLEPDVMEYAVDKYFKDDYQYWKKSVPETRDAARKVIADIRSGLKVECQQ